MAPSLSQEDSLRLDLGEVILGSEEELALTSILGSGLQYIWEARIKKKSISLYEVRAEMEAVISILRRSRYKNTGQIISDIVERMNQA